MMRTGDQSYVKELNRSIVLNILRTHATISRTQIANITGLNKATISSIIDELLRESLAIEIGRGPSAIGRRPILLHFNANTGYAIGLEIAIGSIRAVLTNLSGQVLHVIHRETCDQTVPMVVQQIHNITSELITETKSSPLGILGVGIGVPGLVNFSKGIVLNAPNLQWNQVALQSLVEEEISIPVLIDNEANTGALGEKMYGVGKDIDNIAYISAATGIGVGVILRGELVRGTDGLAGEFGHMTIESQGPKCSCGSRGCLEVFASERKLMDMYHAASGTNADFEELLLQLNNRDPSAVESVYSVGHYLGIGISNIANAINPSMIIIGNRLAQIGVHLLSAVTESVQERCFTKPYSQVNIQLSSLGIDACAMGAASLVLNKYFSGPEVAS